MIKNYSRVVLINHDHTDEGLAIGAVGYIIEVWGDGNYEVEFSDPHGITISQLVLSEAEMRLDEEQ